MAQGPRSQIGRGSALAAAVAATVALFTGQPAVAAFFVTFATSYTLGTIAARQAAKSAAQEVAERRDMVRSAISPRRVIYGAVQTSGTIVYGQVTGAEKEYLHLVVALAGHEVHSIAEIWFDEERLGTLDGSGNVTSGTYSGLVRVKKHLGTAAQTADADLVSESGGKWTTDHRLRGVAYVYVRIRWDQDKFQGIPNIRCLVRGKKCYDPRTGLDAFTETPALHLRDYFAATYGLGCASGELEDTTIATAANTCEEWVALDGALSITAVPEHTTDTWTTSGGYDSRIGTGDRIVLTGVPVPTGLTNGATYYLIRLDNSTYQFASSYQNALEGVAVTFTSNGSGAQTWGTIYQKRYTSNGTFTLDAQPASIEEPIRACMAGSTVYTEGKWKVYAGAYAAPTVSIGASDLRDTLTVKPRRARRELVNQVRGTYTDPARGWTVTDFAPVDDSTFVTQDGGEVISRSIDLAWVNNPFRAQRLGKIYMRRNRGAQLVLPCKITALEACAAESVSVTIAQLGYTAKVFRVLGWKISGEQGGVGVDLNLEEEESSVYTWSASDATSPPVNVGVVLTNPRIVGAPTNLNIYSGNAELLTGTDGSIVSRMRVTWTIAAEANPAGYEVQWKKSTDADYQSGGLVPADTSTFWVAPVQDGLTYDVRVRCQNVLGARSSWLTNSHVVVGKTAAPTAPSSLTITGVLGGVDAAWSAGADADYDHSELWEASSNDRATASKVANVGGNRFARSGLPAAVARWYWVRDVDTSGNVSAWYPSSATAGVTATTLSASGGIPTVADASVITASPGNPPPGGDAYWAVFDNATSKIWRWITASGAYSKAADGGDLSAGSVAADRIAVATLSAIQTNTGSLTVDAAGAIASGSTTWAAGNGFWLGDDGGTYKLRIGAAGGLGISWNGTQLAINGGITLSASTDSYVRAGATDYSTGTGYFLGRSGGQYVLRIGNTTTNYMQWDGSALTVKGSIFTGDVQVDTGGNVRGGQTAYNTGTGFWIGYTGGAYKFSIGNPSSGYLRWTGTALEVYGSIVDTRPFAAGTTPVAAASTEVFMPGAALAWAETKSITVPRAGVLRCTWDIYAGTTGSNTKARIYKNGVATSSEFTYTTIAWHSSTYDITVAAGDEVQLYTYWNSTQGKARNFVLSNSFNESFFVVTLDSY